MHLVSITTVTTLLSGVALASVIRNAHYIHEKRDGTPPGWSKLDAVEKSFTLPMKIALTQMNLDKGPSWLDDVSAPDSENYGKHWTIEDVKKAFAPSDATVHTVEEWLIASGIDAGRIKQSTSGGFLEFSASVDEAEKLLKTKYHVFESVSKGYHVACDEYSLPNHLKDHVDFVMPTVQFGARHAKRDVSADVTNSLRPFSGLQPGPKVDTLATTPAGCDKQITPDCLRQLYNFTKGSTALVKNAIGITEYGNYYQPADLDLFFKTYSPAQVGQRPIFDSIDGGTLVKSDDFFEIGEADLDLQYAMALVYPQNVTLYQVGDTVEGGSFNTFLDAIDGSYCTFEGGDDPKYDPVYPDTAAGGYKGKLQCGVFPPTKVISTSYTALEYFEFPRSYLNRQCTEYMKLGMMGVSVLYASGDDGVAAQSPLGPVCVNTTNNMYENSSDGGRFAPEFPADCPYVTTVGATQVIPGTNITKALASGTQPEEACQTVIYSGGGFSDVFPIPAYQNATVLAYFKNHKPPYSAAQYNNSMKARGYPDIAANGANYEVAINGTLQLVYGTSASTPTLASILTLINEQRAAKNKSSVGFINPVAYANPGVFNDITKGNNPGCNTTGFEAVTGWDPVTGLGTPNYPKMLSLWLSLA